MSFTCPFHGFSPGQPAPHTLPPARVAKTSAPMPIGLQGPIHLTMPGRLAGRLAVAKATVDLANGAWRTGRPVEGPVMRRVATDRETSQASDPPEKGK